MKKTRKILSSILLLLVCGLSVLCLAGCNFFFGPTAEDIQKNLEDNGYTVTVLDGSDYIGSEADTFAVTSLDTYIFGVKGEDRIYVFFFYSIDDAELNGSFINISGLKQGQTNNIIYVGTKQAIKDAKL
ncbi:hypothetical protein J6Y73_03910 [bacterium]|nr:hypothetical protein [bacterium]